ncbi:fibronectin type III domain-containing protein [Terrabacter sp. NPDC000476]|uniref:fibronectin type III domain-containing protein n=1 Tax=Terrabacter sp. NPDC000476 TaxID=3154258 RepID=UPI00331964CE
MHATRIRVIAAGLAAAMIPLVVVGPGARAATPTPTAPTAPTAVVAQRSPSQPSDFTVSWKPAAAVDHYNVSVTAAGRDTVTIVPATATSLAVTGLGEPTTNYRITVSSRDAAGDGTTSAVTNLYSLAPWVPRSLALTRSADLTAVTATWTAPAWPGYGGLNGYDAKLVRVSDGVVVGSASNNTTTTFSATGLDPKRLYRLSVTARNEYGTSAAVGANVASYVPEQPGGAVATRDARNPSVIHVAWKAPAWTGGGPITGYQVVYGPNTLNRTLAVTGLTADVTVPYTIGGLVAVRACNVNGCGYLTGSVKVPVIGVTIPSGPLTTTNPFVGIEPLGSLIHVETRGTVGSTALYPRLYVSVRPTFGTGFTDAQWGQNGAQVMTFGPLPSGTYTVVVHGVGAAGAQTELARKVLVFGTLTQLTAAQWKVVRGQATITGNTVDMPFSGENRVMSTKARTSQDMVLTTRARLRFGWGYGVWFRSSVDAANLVSGYTFQYDPMYGNAFILRHWYKGTECSAPLARTNFPAGFAENVAHALVVVAQGDTVWASVDGTEVFRINSLAAAAAASPCHYPLATGTGIGFRTWSTSSASFTGTTLS